MLRDEEEEKKKWGGGGCLSLRKKRKGRKSQQRNCSLFRTREEQLRPKSRTKKKCANQIASVSKGKETADKEQVSVKMCACPCIHPSNTKRIQQLKPHIQELFIEGRWETGRRTKCVGSTAVQSGKKYSKVIHRSGYSDTKQICNYVHNLFLLFSFFSYK